MSAADTVLSLDFGVNGRETSQLAVGWSFPEDGFTWTVGNESMILLDRPSQPGDYLLQVTAKPAVEPGKVPVQRVYVLVNRWYAGKQLVTRHGTFECRVGWDVIRDHERISVNFLLPDAFRPGELVAGSDLRTIALAVSNISLVRLRGAASSAAAPRAKPSLRESATSTATPLAATPGPLKIGDAMPAGGTPLSEQMLEFESLGADPEFGLVQRSAGAEPLALLRFAEAPIAALLAALEAGFEGVGEPASTGIGLRGREFVLLDRRYGLIWHSWTYEGQSNPQQVQDRKMRSLQFLRGKLLQDLQQGHKLLLYKSATPLAPAELDRLLALLRGYGPNRLLLVEPEAAMHRDGSVDRVREGLLRGYVARFAPPENGADIALDSWITMARNAHRLWQAELVG